MIITCPSCAARYKFDEAKLGDRPRAKTKCAKCGATIEIENPLLAAVTLPPAFVPEVPPPGRRERAHPADVAPVRADEDRIGSATVTGG